MKTDTNYFAKVAVLAAVAFVLMLVEFPLPFVPPFYKMDFSETAVLIGGFALGPMAGVLAIAIHSAGALGKLFSEIVENIDMKPVEGVRSTGASWLACMRFAVLPQVTAGYASYALLRFEINVREASVMGFVGAGGIGQELIVAIRKFYYSDVSAILITIILTVFLIDIGTGWLRGKLFGKDARA